MSQSVYREELPYERFLKKGAESLTNAELLAVILRTGTRNKSALALAREILHIRDTGNTGLSVLHDLTLTDLTQIAGIGEVKAVKILCLAELSRRICGEAGSESFSCSDPQTVAERYIASLSHKPVEEAYVLFLDNKLKLQGEALLSVGTVNRTFLDVREVFRLAVRHGAVQIMLVHNHPSGDPAPSREDIEVTRQIKGAGALLGIPLLDHIVVGKGCYCSLFRDGYLT